MAGHLRKCPHATAEEKALAAKESPTKAEQKAAQVAAAKRARDASASEADDEGGASQTRKKRKKVQAVERAFKLKAGVMVQFLRATQSANLPERWTEDPEVLKLFMMFRSRAADVTPSRRQLGGSLLRDASERIDAEIVETILGEDVLVGKILDCFQRFVLQYKPL
ncbi:hypothetical protein DFH08DRAFT_822898 [Mycena albidolilacea]|uniref:Uncharacterized protein n=1 Tax=Mycena albidolilacea TaxID=1033008 RepID=A0AAD7EBV0_9AGAR|nr:hypothetical protein DFH08DRAFT_822898 [Mycena albidolilacea]